MIRDEGHTFFTLPTELHTYIFTLACTPSSTRLRTIPSYYTAFLTGLALSLVSRYVYAASAPTRHRAVVIYGWQGLLAFERILLTERHSSTSCSHVRYLTLVADELPYSALAKVDKTELEKSFLDVIARILRVIGNDLSLGSPLIFSCLETMFYACSPSNVLPWFTASTTFDYSSSSSPTSETTPHILFPCLKELTVVCNSSSTPNGLHFADAEQNVIHEHTQGTPEVHGIINAAAEEPHNPNNNESESGLPVIPGIIQFPCLEKLSILASTPEQALIALDSNEAAWDVGSTLALDLGELGHKVQTNNQRLQYLKDTEDRDLRADRWPPQTLLTVLLRSKSHWNERWASLRDVARRQQEEMEVERVRSDVNVRAKGLPKIFVLKPGEQV